MATQKLLRCIRNKCCANEPPAKKRSTSDRDSFYYLTKESISECGGQSNVCQPKLKEFSGRSDDFIKQVVIPETQNNGRFNLENILLHFKYFLKCDSKVKET